jgi:hypothetical protein
MLLITFNEAECDLYNASCGGAYKTSQPLLHRRSTDYEPELVETSLLSLLSIPIDHFKLDAPESR